MPANNKSINPSLRNKIITESFAPGCHLGSLAEKYNIPIKTLYEWRSKRFQNKYYKDVPLKKTSIANDNFLPVTLNSDKVQNTVESSLKAASLEFQKFTISIDGKFTTTQLHQIIQSVYNL